MHHTKFKVSAANESATNICFGLVHQKVTPRASGVASFVNARVVHHCSPLEAKSFIILKINHNSSVSSRCGCERGFRNLGNVIKLARPPPVRYLIIVVELVGRFVRQAF